MAGTRPSISRDDFAAAFHGEWGRRFPPKLSPRQLAELLGLSVSTIYEWISKGRLDGALRKRGKHCLIWRNKALEILFTGKDWNERPRKGPRRGSGHDLPAREEEDLRG